MKNKLFRLIGHAMQFRVEREYRAAGFIPAVVGVSVCGKYQTVARVADIQMIEEAA